MSLSWQTGRRNRALSILAHGLVPSVAIVGRCALGIRPRHGSYLLYSWSRAPRLRCGAKPPPSQVFLLAERSNFETFDGEFERSVRDMFSCIGKTAIDENGFKVQRGAEHRSCNAKMSHVEGGVKAPRIRRVAGL